MVESFMLIKEDILVEALNPSEYRSFVKGWDKSRFKDIFMNPKYEHDKNGYRVYIPLPEKTDSGGKSSLEKKIESELGDDYDIVDYKKGLVKDKKKNQTIKIGKILTRLKKTELLNKFNTDKSRAGTKNKYMVVISRHPYDIAGMSTDRGWTSCMNLHDGEYKQYVPIEIKQGSIIAYVTTIDDKNLNHPVGRIMIKPFVDILGSKQIAFGIENKVYGTKVYGFIPTVRKWINEVNKSRDINYIAIFKKDAEVYHDSHKKSDFVLSDKNNPRGAASLIKRLYNNPRNKLYKKDKDDILRVFGKDMSKWPAQFKKFLIKFYESNALEFLDESLTEDEKILAVTTFGDALRYIDNPSDKVIMAALKYDASAIRFVDHQTEKQQMMAIKTSVWRNGYNVIDLLKNPSDRVLSLLLVYDPYAIKYIKDPSEKLQLMAVRGDGHVIEYIKDPSEKVQLAAIDHDDELIEVIANPTDKVLVAALRHHPGFIEHIDNPTEIMQMTVVKRDAYMISFIDNPTLKVQLYAVKQDASVISEIEDPPEEVQLAAVKKNAYAIIDIDNPTEKVQLIAVRKTGFAIEYINDPSEKVQLAAIKDNYNAIDYIDHPTKKAIALAKKLKNM